jgi:hypothetical protein
MLIFWLWDLLTTAMAWQLWSLFDDGLEIM